MNIINIKGIDIPIVFLTTENEEEEEIIAMHGLINIVLPEGYDETFEDVINKHPYRIIRMYNHMRRKMVNRSEEEFEDICTKYFIKYEKQLQVEAKEIIYAPLKIYEHGYAFNDYTIVINSLMQYMSEDLIHLTIYHELCHLYTLKNYNTLEHDEDFYKIFNKVFSEIDDRLIMNISPL